VPRRCKEDNWSNEVSSVRESVKKSFGREPPFREDLSSESKESPLLEDVTRKRLVKTQQAGKDLEGAVVICKVWRLAMAL
jgi:hypothetical protein